MPEALILDGAGALAETKALPRAAFNLSAADIPARHRARTALDTMHRVRAAPVGPPLTLTQERPT